MSTEIKKFDEMDQIIDESMSKDQLLEFSPAELQKEYEKYQTIHRKNCDMYNTCGNDGEFRELMMINEDIEAYMDFVEEQTKINAEHYAKETVDNVLETKVEETIPEEVTIEVVEETEVSEFIDPDDFEIEIDEKLTVTETKPKRKKSLKEKRVERKQKEDAKIVREILEGVDEREAKRAKRAKSNEPKIDARTNNPTEVTSYFTEPETKRRAALREPGVKKGDWYQVSYRLLTERKAHFKEYAMGALEYLKGIISGIGPYISYFAEAIVMADYENRRWFLDKRREEQIKRFIHFADWFLEGGVDMPETEIENVRRSFELMGCDTDFKKRDLIAKYRQELDFIAHIDYYQFVREHNDAKLESDRNVAQAIVDALDDKIA